MAATIGGRLDEALAAWAARRGKNPDKKEFQLAMTERLGRGSGAGVSYPAVLGYFSGKGTPSVEWLSEAADVLGVRVSWLAFNEGPMTEYDTEDELGEVVFGTLDKACPEFRDASEFVRSAVFNAWADHLSLHLRHAADQGEDIEGEAFADRIERHREVAAWVGRALRSSYAFPWMGMVSSSALDEFFLMMSLALRTLATGQQPGSQGKAGEAPPNQIVLPDGRIIPMLPLRFHEDEP